MGDDEGGGAALDRKLRRDDALARAVKRGDRDALAKAINRGKARIRSGSS